jgi:hypothetical protein
MVKDGNIDPLQKFDEAIVGDLVQHPQKTGILRLLLYSMYLTSNLMLLSTEPLMDAFSFH